MRNVARCTLFFGLYFAVTGGTLATAGVTTFYGFDPASGPGGARPSSDAAHAAFLASLAPTSVGVENFEGDPIGSFLGGTRNVDFASTPINGTITSLAQNYLAEITNVNDSVNDIFASSGTTYLRIATVGNSSFFDLQLSAHVKAFGFYGSDLSDYAGFPGGPIPPIQVTLDGGTPINVLNVSPDTIPSGSANFFGVISDTSFSSVRFINPPGTGGDGIGVDDLVVGQAATPVPSTLVMSSILFGMFGVARSYKRLKQNPAAA